MAKQSATGGAWLEQATSCRRCRFTHCATTGCIVADEGYARFACPDDDQHAVAEGSGSFKRVLMERVG